MNFDTLQIYLYLKSNQASRNVAKNYFSDLSVLGTGSDSVYYIQDLRSLSKVTIRSQDQKITTECDCKGYSNELCSHEITLLQYLLNQLDNGKTVTVDGNLIEPRILNLISLPNNLITDELLKNLSMKRMFPLDSVILTAEEGLVETQISDWQIYRQKFSFDDQKKQLTFECNCSPSTKMCAHISPGLKKIKDVFGENFFHPDYFEIKTNEFLVKYGLTREDDYEQLFSFSLGPDGFTVNSTFNNIVPATAPIAGFKLQEKVETLSELPHFPENRSSAFGFCVCLRFDSFGKAQWIPSQAKFNRSRTDFASGFSEISYYNIEESLTTFEKEQNLIVKTLHINTLLKKFSSEKRVSILKRAIQDFNEIIPALKESFIFKHHEYFSFIRRNLSPVTIADTPIELYFTFEENELLYTLKAKVKIEGIKYDLGSHGLYVTPLFVFAGDKIYPIQNALLSIHLEYYREFSELNYFKKNFSEVYKNIILPLSKKYKVKSKLFKKSLAAAEETNLEKHIYVSDYEGTYVTFNLAIQYENQLVPVFSNEKLIEKVSDESNGAEIVYKERNQSFEDNFIEEFRSLHPSFQDQDGMLCLTPEELMENYWLLNATAKMKALGIKVFGANELKSFRFNVHKPRISFNLKSDIDWFDIEFYVSFGSQRVSLKDLQKTFVKKSNYVELGDGTIGILPEQWMKKFAGYFKVGEIKRNNLQISNYQFGIIDELYHEMENKPSFLEELYEKKKRLQNISEIEETKVPEGIHASLREYQQHGLNWLAFLDKNQLGGCLADDMGLGKTLQTITFLQHLKKNNDNLPPSLIIAPTSLIFNWKSEIEKFCPSLKLLSYVGNGRSEHTENFGQYDLIISTYGSLLNDIEFLKDYKFHYIILDESQAIKNPNSKRYKAVRLLNSYNRLALTGTPIENNTFDLYSQLNFLNPGLLGNMTHFRTNFAESIDRDKNVETSQLLAKIINPFMLRRTKEQVATELPEKTESIIYCEMNNDQRKVYESFRDKYRDYLLNKIDENGLEKSQLYILEGLTKLRQICNSTALISDEEDYGNYSVKLELLIENIKEKTGNHKILVFSQFVKMLQIIRERLEDEDIEYEYLDGQTSNRQEKVENFQSDSSVRVFLISLKAGGTGLNLTQADYVFIVDPWWNPAVENQAIDRCYRIGQSKNVMAYRMICKDTIEEKIVNLQNNKKKVASSIIQIDDEKKSFDLDEVRNLFS